MKQHISKSDLVAEIERRLDELYELLPDASKVENGMITISEACNTGKYTALESFKDYINTVDVKEVDLEKEFSQWWKGERAKDYNVDILYERYSNVSIKLAKHFFELGMSVSNKAQKGE